MTPRPHRRSAVDASPSNGRAWGARAALVLALAWLSSGCQSSSEGGAGSSTTDSGIGRGGIGASSGGGAVGASGASNGGTSNGGGASNAAGGTSNGGGTQAGGSTGTGGTTGSGGATSSGGGTQAGGSTSTGGAPTDGGGSSPCLGAKPDATNTGVPPGVALTVVDGDVTVTEDGSTIDAEDIQGFLVVKASHVTVKRSIVRGGVATHNGDGIAVESGTDVLIEDCEVALAHPSAYLDGISGSNFTVLRTNIHGGVDGMKLGSNSTVECCYIHDETSFASDPNQGGGPTHNDAIQILSGVGIRVIGNQLVAATDQNSAIQVTQDFGAVTDLVVDSNWADGGGCTVNFASKGAPTLTGVTVTNNRFGRNSYFDCPILKSTQTTLDLSGNVWDDDGTPVPVQTHD